MGSGFDLGVLGSRFWAQGFALGVSGPGLGFGVHGSRFRVYGVDQAPPNSSRNPPCKAWRFGVQLCGLLLWA